MSSRGFNGRYAKKLQALIDGRSTYTRTFAGVYWESQDVMIEDIDRIEVIRGPGATLWGANAFNGVINIITKHSSQTQGGTLHVGGGTEEHGFGSFRYGTKFGEDTTDRAYIKGYNRDNNSHIGGANAEDGWDKVQAGFRVDAQLSPKDALTFQGDIYHSNINQISVFPQISSEEVITYEAGYRTTFSKAVSLDITGFYNDYRNLRIPRFGDLEFKGNSIILPFKFTNDLQGKTYGVEAAAVWQMLDWWRWDVNYSWLHTELATNFGLPRTGVDPEHRVSVRGALSPRDDIDLDFWLLFGQQFFNFYIG